MKNFFLLLFFTLSLPSLWAQSPCTGNVAIETLANGMDYTITVGAGGAVDISVTVVDNPVGLVGFLGGAGNPISFPDGTGTFTYNLTGQADPYVLDMFFNWAAGGAGNSETVSCSAGPAGPEICTGNVPIETLANGMDYTITVAADGTTVDVSVTVVDNPVGLVGFLGGAGNPISFPDGTGTFTYNLTGQAAPYVLDMFFNWAAGGAGNSETVACPAGGGPAALDLPITFEDPTVDYNLADFGGASSFITLDPTDTTNTVLCQFKNAGAETWAGTTVGDSGLENPIAFSPGNTTITMSVWAPTAGTPILLKVENSGNGGIAAEVLVSTTVGMAFETLSFDLSLSTNFPLDLNQIYDKISVFGNFGNGGAQPTVYFDDLILPPPPPVICTGNVAIENLANGMDYTIVSAPDGTVDVTVTVVDNPTGLVAFYGGPGNPISFPDATGTFTYNFPGQTIGDLFVVDIFFNWAGNGGNSETITIIVGGPCTLPDTDVVFCVDMSCFLDAPLNPSVFGNFTTPPFDINQNLLSDPDGDGIWCATVTIAPGTYEYLFFDANQGAEGFDEGAPCTVTNFGFTNRSLTVGGTSPQMENFGWESCGTDCVTSLPPPDLPITFEDPGIDYNLDNFGGMVSFLAPDPTDSTNTVVCSTKPVGAETWAGTTVGADGLQNPVPFTATDLTMTVRVWSPSAGTPFLLKVENTANPGQSSEVLVSTTVAMAWETLVFDFANSSTAPIFLNIVYDKVSVFANFGNPGTGMTYYFDDIMFGLPYAPEIQDPCTCLDNSSVIDLDAGTGGDDGTFSELVAIAGPGGGPLPSTLAFVVTAITGGDIVVGDPLVFNANNGHYEISFEHVDEIGYTISVQESSAGTPTGPVLSIGNVCAYPNPVFVPVPADQYCAVDAAETLGANEALPADGLTFTIDGAPATEIDPAALALGTHLVVMTWDGSLGTNNGSGTVANPNQPGCIQTVQKTIEIINDAPVITCPPTAVLDCTESIPDGVTTLAEFIAAGGTVSANCTVTSIAFTDVTSVTNCGIEVERIYTIASGTAASSCVQMLRTVDTTPPVIVCPPSQTLTCFETAPAPITTAADFIAAGGVISDDCTADLSDFTVFSQNADNGGDNCPGNGQVIDRTYFVQDLCGNTSTCTQTFTYLESTSGPVITSILPTCFKYCASLANPMDADITFDTDCNFGATVNITGPTQIGQDNCPGSIYRYTYTVTDDCGRTSAAVTRDFVIGNDGPTIECAPFNLLLECGDPNNADYIAAHIATATANSSCELGVNINHFPQNFNNITCNTSTVVTFVATDDCGRSSTCTTTINISDNTAPVITSTYVDGVCNEAVCGSNVSFWFNSWKSKVLEGLSATDACDSNVSFSTAGSPNSATQDCPDGTAETVVTWLANDNCGNQGEISYSFYVVSADAPAPSPAIMGMVATEQTETVENVSITLEGNGLSIFDVTAANGMYGFENLVEGQNYSVTPLLDENPLNGVSSFDLVLISKHILQLEQLDSPYKIIAADINHSGSVTTMDMVELRKLILHIDDDFANNTSWRFVEAAYVFPTPTNPFATVFPEEVNINGLAADEEHDFVGVKIGDVNGSAVANQFAQAEDRSAVDELVFEIENQKVVVGQTVDVTFRSDNFNAIHGYQFSLGFDQAVLQFNEVQTGTLANLNEDNFGLALLDNGVITTSWTNNKAQTAMRAADLFTISFIAKADGQLRDLLTVNSSFTKAEAYNGNLDLMDVQMRFDAAVAVTNELRLYQNMPNPFKQETLIGFELPEAGAATLNIYDVSGKLLKQIEGEYAKGYNSISLSEDGLSPGLLHYQLIAEAGIKTRKMLFSGK